MATTFKQFLEGAPNDRIKELNTPNAVKEDGEGAEANLAKPNKKYRKILFKKIPPKMNPYK